MGIRTTVVGSYPWPEWLAARPTRESLRDATAVVLKTQELLGVDLVADGELYRFDPDLPDSNGMIEAFVRPMSGVRCAVGRADLAEFRQDPGMSFRARPSGVVEGPLGEGGLDLPSDCLRARELTDRPLKFTLTGPHMLAKTLLDRHYGSKAELCLAIADVLAAQVAGLDADVVQVDEANLPGHPEEQGWALAAMNRVLDAVPSTPAVHLCFGNYGGQTIQQGDWAGLRDYLSGLHADHVLLEMTRRDETELARLGEVEPRIRFGIGVVDVKSNVVETADVVAARIGKAVETLGAERVGWVCPDCGFWMLRRSVADRKIRALVEGRNRFEGRS